MRRERRTTRRGSVLLAVMVVVGIAALIGTSVMLRVEGERATAAVSLRRTRARALAWSGVQAVMAELAGKREEMLDGGTPTVTATWELFTEGEARGVVRLAPIGAKGETLVPETAKLDVNHATKEMLAKLEGVGEDGAAKIVGARKEGFSSVEALAAILGDGEDGGMAGDAGAGMGADLPKAAWRDALTTFAFDPNLQCGVKGNEKGHGSLRVNLAAGWSAELRRAIEERFGDDAAKSAEAALKDRAAVKADSELIGLLSGLGVDPKAWGAMLDFFTTSDDEYRPGRVDVNRAGAAVLACVPGIDAATAGKIVSVRESLSAEVKRDVTWPLTEGLMKKEDFRAAADWLCTRSMQWRVRVEAGIVRGEDAGLAAEGGGAAAQGRGAPGTEDRSRRHEGGGVVAPEEMKMEHKVVLEAVIDVAGRRPRIAYLRDVTYLEAARRLAARHEGGREEATESDGHAEDGGAEAEGPDAPRSEDRSRWHEDGGAAGSVTGEGMDELSSAPRASAEREGAEREAIPESRVTKPGSGADTAAPGDGRGASPEPEPGTGRPSAPRDRRIGRWTAGGKA